MKIYTGIAALLIVLAINYYQIDAQTQNNNNLYDLSYSNVEIRARPPVTTASTTTTTPAPTTTKKKGFFSGITNLFKKSDKKNADAETTTTTARPTTTKAGAKVAVTPTTAATTTTTARAAVTQKAAAGVPTPSTTTTTTVRTVVTPKPVAGLPTPTNPTTTTVRTTSKLNQDAFPPLPAANQVPGGVTTTRPTPSTPKTPIGAVPANPANPWTGNHPSLTATTTTVKPMVNFVPHEPVISGPDSTTGKPEKIPDSEILALSETLFSKDVNNANKFVTTKYQGRTWAGAVTDDAPDPFLVVDEKQAFAIPTIEKMRLLYNNYEQDTMVNEVSTPNEKKEENDFVDALMTTSVMRALFSFFQQKGIVTPDPKTHRDLLKSIWFNMYSRGLGKIGSSGFEHVFLNENKNSSVIGLHNWVYFYEEEKAGHADYKGYMKKLELGNKGAIVKMRLSYNQINKPTNSMFVGTSPELEMALYTLCFQVRPDGSCPLTYNGKTFSIQTYIFRYRGKDLVGSAYPDF